MPKKIESFAPYKAQPLTKNALKKENKVTSLAVAKLSQKFQPKKSIKATAPTQGTKKTSKLFFAALKRKAA